MYRPIQVTSGDESAHRATSDAIWHGEPYSGRSYMTYSCRRPMTYSGRPPRMYFDTQFTIIMFYGRNFQ